MAGKLVVLSGASSVGKKDVTKLLLEDPELKLIHAISMTTRPQKEKEVDGLDYYFTDTASFARAIKDKQMLEYTEFNGYYYGMPRAQVEFLLSQNKNVLLVVDAQGVGPIKLNMPEAICFFLMPKSLEDLEKSVHDKYGDDQASVNLRINKAKMEMELSTLFNNQVSNADPFEAYKKIKEIIVENKGEK